MRLSGDWILFNEEFVMSINDDSIRSAAFTRVRLLESFYGDSIPWSEISKGININGAHIHITSKAEGIFKPKEINEGAISIKTTVPKKGRYNIYDDKEFDDGFFHYSLKASGNLKSNSYLKQNYLNKTPLIYFIGVTPGFYKAVFPCFVNGFDETTQAALVAPGIHIESYASLTDQKEKLLPPTFIERRYAVREVKARLHQEAFRDMVLTAYNHKCAISGLPVPDLLEAAHIIPDAHEQGLAEVQNGICLSRLHHKAFDKMLIGIRPDHTIVVSEKLKSISDGPILEYGLKQIDGLRISIPKKIELQPSSKYLEMRWEHFLSAN